MQTITNQSSSDSENEDFIRNITSLNHTEEMETDDSVDSNTSRQDLSDLCINQHANNSAFTTSNKTDNVQSQENPMRKVVVNAVLDALKV
jgi:predicted DNA binding CopG/RHH family protein